MSDSIHTLLDHGTMHLQGHSAAPRLDAETLLADLLGKDRSYLIAHSDEVLGSQQQHTFEQRIQRQADGEPHAYILGYRDFWSLRLRVNPATLIPRADTETVVETTLEQLNALPESKHPVTVADLGTGSGAIALALAVERPDIRFLATDVSQDALDAAQQNASAHWISNCQFTHHDWRTQAELPASPFHLIVSNPPYIASDDPHLQQGDLPREPLQALASGADGLDDIRIISQRARQWLRPGGWLVLEHGHDQAHAVQAILSTHGYQQLETINDLGNNPRCTKGRLA